MLAQEVDSVEFDGLFPETSNLVTFWLSWQRRRISITTGFTRHQSSGVSLRTWSVIVRQNKANWAIVIEELIQSVWCRLGEFLDWETNWRPFATPRNLHETELLKLRTKTSHSGFWRKKLKSPDCASLSTTFARVPSCIVHPEWVLFSLADNARCIVRRNRKQWQRITRYGSRVVPRLPKWELLPWRCLIVLPQITLLWRTFGRNAWKKNKINK